MSKDDEKPEPEEQGPQEALDPPPSPNVQAWTKKALECTNRMSTDEAYRKEIAKRIK